MAYRFIVDTLHCVSIYVMVCLRLHVHVLPYQGATPSSESRVHVMIRCSVLTSIVGDARACSERGDGSFKRLSEDDRDSVETIEPVEIENTCLASSVDHERSGSISEPMAITSKLK
jgi:hypothetical protein